MLLAFDAMAGKIGQPLCVAVAGGIMPAWLPVRVAALVSSRNDSNDGNEPNEALSAAGPNKRMKLTKRGFL
jgi:hypothetical protein